MPAHRTASAERIVEAAVELFERRGYAQTTIDQIAEEAGIAKPTLYQYVDSKQAILGAIAQAVHEDARTAHEKGMAGHKPAVERLRTLVHGYVGVVTRRRSAIRVLLAETAELDEEQRIGIASWALRAKDDFASLLTGCRRAGLISPAVQPSVAAYLVTAMLVGMANWYDPRGPLTPENVAEQVLALIGIPSR